MPRSPTEIPFWSLLRSRPLLSLNGLLLLLLLLGLCGLLWPHWTGNADLSHGYFMPVVFGLLLSESRRCSTPRYLRDSPGLLLGQGLLLGLGLACLGVSALYALALDWGHSLAASAGTAGFVALSLAVLLSLARHSVAWLPFNWASLLGCGLWLLCCPLPPGTYSQLSLKLQLGVSQAVITALQLLGVAATRHGNIIELARTTVGIEEACSGIRSLISCTFAGFFFTATLVRHPVSRALLLLAAPVLAVGMNFLRSLTLTLLANADIDIGGAWHDATGFAVLGLTALLLGALALGLSKIEPPPVPVETPPEVSTPKRGLRFEAPVLLALALALTGGLGCVALTQEGPKEARVTALPASLLPGAPPPWQVISEPELTRFAEVLQTRQLWQKDYLREGERGPVQVSLYLAYWAPNQATPSQVAIHTPDGCWPGAGWRREPEPQRRQRLPLGDGLLPEAEYRRFSSPQNHTEYVWYWHLYDGRPIEQLDPYKVPELLRMALRFGFRRGEEQWFVRISANRPWEELQNDPLLLSLFENLRLIGF